MRRRLAVTCLSISLFTAGSLPAHADLAEGISSYRNGDYANAFREFKKDGSPSAQFYLSIMYQKGDGTRQDQKASLELLRKAAELGLDVAQANLGLIYYNGEGVPVDEREGLKWLRKAAEQGLAEAKTVLQMAGR